MVLLIALSDDAQAMARPPEVGQAQEILTSQQSVVVAVSLSRGCSTASGSVCFLLILSPVHGRAEPLGGNCVPIVHKAHCWSGSFSLPVGAGRRQLLPLFSFSTSQLALISQFPSQV